MGQARNSCSKYLPEISRNVTNVQNMYGEMSRHAQTWTEISRNLRRRGGTPRSSSGSLLNWTCQRSLLMNCSLTKGEASTGPGAVYGSGTQQAELHKVRTVAWSLSAQKHRAGDVSKDLTQTAKEELHSPMLLLTGCIAGPWSLSAHVANRLLGGSIVYEHIGRACTSLVSAGQLQFTAGQLQQGQSRNICGTMM